VVATLAGEGTATEAKAPGRGMIINPIRRRVRGRAGCAGAGRSSWTVRRKPKIRAAGKP